MKEEVGVISVIIGYSSRHRPLKTTYTKYREVRSQLLQQIQKECCYVFQSNLTEP